MAEPSPSPGQFADLGIQSHYSSEDDLLNAFYVPVLERAVAYDRVAGYFSSSAFMSAAAGLARFIHNQGTIRLLVGVQLSEEDREALLGRTAIDEVLSSRLGEAMPLAADEIEQQRWQVIAWLVQQERLTIRVGVPCDSDGMPLAASQAGDRYFHSKFGVVTDTVGDRLAFQGSINESAAGWRANYESFSVYPSWKPEIWDTYGQQWAEDFERLWEGKPSDSNSNRVVWRTVPLPQAARDRLLQLVPENQAPPARDPLEPPLLTEQERQRLADIGQAPSTCTGVGLASAGIVAWPHQEAIARHITDTWPRSYLLADEVGLGKTIEVGLVLRELLLSGRANTALLLVPASVLIQWQEELAEKFLLDVPRFEGGELIGADGVRKPLGANVNHWRSTPVLLASSHLARRRDQREQLLDGEGWDLLFVDEAHHARRRGAKPNDTPNQLLTTLLELKKHGLWRALLLASATPMQLHTHDLWDLLNLFGLPPEWDAGAAQMQQYYEEVQQPLAHRDWQFLKQMLAGHLTAAEPDEAAARALKAHLGAVKAQHITRFHKSPLSESALRHTNPDIAPHWNRWLRANTPVSDRVFRTTRTTLRTYRSQGMLADSTVIPDRVVTDEFCDLGSANSLYNRIESYITRHYDIYLQATGAHKPLGFIMTIYRRRLTSSFRAIRCSLDRRRGVLTDHRAMAELLDADDKAALEGADWDENPTNQDATTTADLAAEIDELNRFIADLDALPPDEPKMSLLQKLLAQSFADGHRTVVVFTQYADTLRYVRDRLVAIYGTQVVCYYGGGGERWSLESRQWVPIPKEEVKELFRRGDDVRIMLGTDSMSEGLNLQTCARVINFDLPWNFMRVEQRIGRVDRIGGQPKVEVTNLFYSDTVEEDIYRRIRDCLDWFTNVVGNAQPVLAATESVFEKAAMGRIDPTAAARELTEAADRLEQAPIKLADLDAVPDHETALQPAMTLGDLQAILHGMRWCRDRFASHPDFPDAWLLSLDEASPHPVTFNPTLYQETPHLDFLSWGSPLLTRLLELALST
ncbi:MAG: helicase-related protein [bacterium]|nr:helicase-related protein [bacterium]